MTGTVRIRSETDADIGAISDRRSYSKACRQKYFSPCRSMATSRRERSSFTRDSGQMANKKRVQLAGFALAALALLAALEVVLRVVPFPDARYAAYPSGLVVLDRAGDPLRVWLGPGDIDSQPVARVDPEGWMAKAIVAAEDQRFWTHGGLDPLALARALRQNLSSGRRISGASTLSTQVIRLVDQRPRTLGAKAVEAFRALQLERRYGKEAILTQYLNRAPFGGNLEGVEAAARRYFGKGADALSLAEAALLAGLPQSPSRFRPDRHLDRARVRQAYVLDRMVATGVIDARQRGEALAQPLAVHSEPRPFRAPHFALLAAQTAGPGAARVRTTLDPTVQRLAEDALARRDEALAREGVKGAAVAVFSARSGEVLALVGSPGYGDPLAGQVNGALAARAAGSTLKPFVYALAFDRGLVTPQTVLADVPAVYRDLEPGNFDATFRGLVSVRDALVLSLNLPVLGLEQRVGLPLVHRTLRAAGLATLGPDVARYGIGLALGNAEVRLLDLAAAYACLANGGRTVTPRLLGDGASSDGEGLFTPEACWLVADLLSGDERAMDVTGHAAEVPLPRFAWKTGTSAGCRDAWVVAFNPEYVIGVWMGRPGGGGSEQLVGRTAAAPVAWAIARGLYPGGAAPWFARPAGLERRPVCAVSGQPAGAHCGAVVEDDAIAGVSSRQPCAIHRGDGHAHWPPAVAAFLERQTGPAGAALAPQAGGVVRILSPARGTSYRLLDVGPAGAQQVPLRAAGARGALYWFVNNRPLGPGGPDGSLSWPMERGRFEIVCSDALGQSDRVEIAVE